MCHMSAGSSVGHVHQSKLSHDRKQIQIDSVNIDPIRTCRMRSALFVEPRGHPSTASTLHRDDSGELNTLEKRRRRFGDGTPGVEASSRTSGRLQGRV